MLQALGVSDVKMEEGSMRVDANVSVRPRRRAGVRHQGRGQEHELAAVARARDRLRDRAADRGARGGRADRAGDAPLGRGRRPHPRHAHEGGVERLPLLPRARPRAGRARPTRCGPRRATPMPELPAARRARLVAEWGIGDADARVLVDVAGLADYAEAAVRRARRRHAAATS